MRKLMMSKKGSGTARAVAKVVACMLSIMLVVTGIVPGFAAESKASKQNGHKIAENEAVQKGQSKTSEQGGKKPAVSKEEVGKDKQKQSDKKFSKKKESAKKNKIKNKKDRYFDLNPEGNISARLDESKNLYIFAKGFNGNMHISREKWKDMVLALGGTYDPNPAVGLDWGSDVMNIEFQTDGIYLPSDSSTLFSNFRGMIIGCGRLKTNNVINMFAMFYHAANANPDVFEWDTSNVTNMRVMFKGARNADPDVSR